MTATETVSYSLVILAGLAVAAGAAWAVFKGALPSNASPSLLFVPNKLPFSPSSELVLEPREYTVFGLALERCRGDARVATRLGAPLSGYGVESGNRAARQRIRHKIETDAAGVEHVLVQFQLRGPRGVATVFAEGVKDGAAPGGYRLGFIRVTDPGGALRPIAVDVDGTQAGFGGGALPAGSGFAVAAGSQPVFELPPPPPLLADAPAPPPRPKSAWGAFTSGRS